MSTLYTSQKTHQGMLPQSSALETESADNPRVGTKRGSVAGESSHTGVQHGRGEIENGRTCPPQRHLSSPTSVGLEGAGGLTAPRSTEHHASPKYTAASVGVLDRDGSPLMPCHPARARALLKSGRAVVVHHTPFVIRLKYLIEESVVSGVEVGVDPGSKFTGVTVFRVDTDQTRHGLFSVEVQHRGSLISKNLHSRAAWRRGRRSRNLRYRQPRFDNRTKPKGWLAPSLQHRVDGTVATLARLARWFPVNHVHVERVLFDMAQMQDPEISGVEYQQGTLYGFEVREYLLAKWRRTCAYCDASGVGPGSTPLNIDHLRPISRGGSHRVSNLVLSCVKCNRRKSNQLVEEFLTHDSARLARILRQVKSPLRDAAAVNITRYALVRSLETTFAVTTGTTAQTKWNRRINDVPKSHTIDALCAGAGEVVVASIPSTVLVARSTGRGSYARTRSDAFGFPRLLLTRTKRHFGFATGDFVRAVVSRGKNEGTHVGRVAVRASGSFNIKVGDRTIQGINHKHCQLIQQADGWSYQQQKEAHHAA
jgi:5-methylcytosine-specific restriction endonuclease McrA